MDKKEEMMMDLILRPYSECEGVFENGECTLHKGAEKKVFGAGNLYADVMIIGEAPREKDEDHPQGIPFMGPYGKVLQELLTEVGIKRKDVYMTNTVLCRSYNFKQGTAKKPRKVDREPTREEVTCCYKRLCSEIYIVDPVVLILLGKGPTSYLTKDNRKMGTTRGRVYSVEIESYYSKKPLYYAAIPTWSLGYLLKNPMDRPGDPRREAKEDIAKAVGLAKGYKKRIENELQNTCIVI